MLVEKSVLEEAERIVDKINSGMEYVCFGAGRYFYDFINNSCLKKHMFKLPKYVCDNNKSLVGKRIGGVEVVAPEALLEEDPDKLIIVMSAVAPFGIMADLQSLRLQRHYFYILPLSQLEAYGYYREHADQIRQVYGYLEDERSKAMYQGFWELSLRGIMNYASIYSPNAYWDNDLIPRLSDGWRVLYAGAFDGKHIDRALKSNPDITFHGFEPNRKMYQKLKDQYGSRPNVMLYPYALDSRKNVSQFDPNVLLGAMVVRGDEEGGKRIESKLDQVECTTIDSEIRDGLDLIALDIEGYELEALKGGKDLIRTYKPALGICVYHRISHYVEVPLLMKEYHPDYRLYFRHHCVVSTESVMYAL